MPRVGADIVFQESGALPTGDLAYPESSSATHDARRAQTSGLWLYICPKGRLSFFLAAPYVPGGLHAVQRGLTHTRSDRPQH